MTNLCFIFILFSYVYASERIWLIRNCDKPKDIHNMCCSNKGYARANAWNLYFERYFSDNYIKIYSSNFYKGNDNLCIRDIGHIGDKDCRFSQRTYLTANFLQNSLLRYNLSTTINSDYCIGFHKDMIKNILNYTEFTDTIIVWEHIEMLDILRYFDFNVEFSPDKIENNYDLIFMIDTKHRRMYYDCFDYNNNVIQCNRKITKILHNISTINSYYNIVTNIIVPNNNTDYFEVWKVMLSVIFAFAILMSFVTCFAMCLYEKQIREGENTQFATNIPLYWN